MDFKLRWGLLFIDIHQAAVCRHFHTIFWAELVCTYVSGPIEWLSEVHGISNAFLGVFKLLVSSLCTLGSKLLLKVKYLTFHTIESQRKIMNIFPGSLTCRR